MELIPASSPGMMRAHAHSYVKTIVSILMQDRKLLRPIAIFLQQCHSSNQPNFEEKLDALRLNQSRPNANGTVVPPDHVLTLIQTLHDFYKQSDTQVKYLRGAVVELLALKLICHRYDQPDEFCLTNQRFSENHRDITVQEVDVAALSVKRHKAEGYECKINANGFEAYDSINLCDLVDAADDREYRVNVGFIAFENAHVMNAKLKKFHLPDCIELYSLDSLEGLQYLPLLDN